MGFRKRTAGAPAAEAKKEETKAVPAKAKGNFRKLGAIIEKREGDGVYLKLDGGKEGILPEIIIDGKKVTGFQFEDPTIKFERMVKAGKMTEKEANDAAARVPAYVLFEVTAITE